MTARPAVSAANGAQGAPTSAELLALVDGQFARSIDVPRAFFDEAAPRISLACLAMARRFHRGGRLLVFGRGGSATDAQHVSVEFVHPVIVGKRALPALSLSNDGAALSGIMRHAGDVGAFSRQLAVLARPEDIALGLTTDGADAAVIGGLEHARRDGLLTIGAAGGDGGAMADLSLDFAFVVPSDDAFVVQETQETLYHVLWELVHVFFEHAGLLDEARR